MSRNCVNLNVNPCKMCMPMGAVMAVKGIEKSMMVLHGSQGCATYIRRHMAGHFNEPVDVASSSLTEDGTVFGGEKNLLAGIKNVIKQYAPGMIGIATTCLAETIGEDVAQMLKKFSGDKALSGTQLVAISTPGYGGSHTEGYAVALLSIVHQLAVNRVPNGRINIITTSISPGDTRALKSVLDLIGVDYILLPDNSETLDAPYEKDYRRIPKGGTPLHDIAAMAGAKVTLEIGLTLDESLSAGMHLKKAYGIPLYRCALPTGIQNTDTFIKLLAHLAGKPVPAGLNRQRGRYLDAMIDSHKYNSEGRALIFGEPEQVYAITRLCMENGIRPVVVSTGTRSDSLKELIAQEPEEMPLVVDDTDFDTLEKLALEHKANLLIGNSDGKVLTEHLGIPLVRTGFPIHDRIGGQRLVHTFYEGSLRLLDDITNTLLGAKYARYRKEMVNSFCHTGENTAREVPSPESVLDKKTQEHPCFGKEACKNARIHIPVAPACNLSCNYCNRKFDCVNESRPGVTSSILTPAEARDRFLLAKEKLPNLKVVGIAGPGDALANMEKTRESIRLIREADPEITFCLSTNGLMLPYYAHELVDLGVTHFTVTINAVDIDILTKIYDEVHFMGLKLKGEAGCRILLANQLAGLQALALRNVVVKVNIVMIKGINDQHIEKVVETVKSLGVFMTNIMPLIPAAGSRFEHFPQTNRVELNDMRKKCSTHLNQMFHCRQCRADAAGTLDHDICHTFAEPVSKPEEATGEESFYKLAVTTRSGFLVDQHFGQAGEFHIYEVRGSKVSFMERRSIGRKYCGGQEACGDEEDSLDVILKTLADCRGVLTMQIGERPSQRLTSSGMTVIMTCGRIQDCITEASRELDKQAGQPLRVEAVVQTQ